MLRVTLVHCLFDQLSHSSCVSQDLVTRNAHDMVALLGQILIAALIMLAAFVGLMMLTIDLNDQLQSNATEIDGVRRNGVFTTKLLASAAAIADHLPHVMCKLVCGGSLTTSKRNRLCIAPRSFLHAAPPIHDRG
jgi:hypothetical protein